MSQIADNATNAQPRKSIHSLEDGDVARLAHAMRTSATRFRKIVGAYRRRGITDREIVAAMAASPNLVDPLGRGR
jgi:hypothetical protein